MHWKKVRKAQYLIFKLARSAGKSVRQVRNELEIARLEGVSCTNPEIKRFWNTIPYDHVYPSPEEIVLHLYRTNKDDFR